MVAVNKIDKEGADPNRVRGELAQQGLTPADWGGDTEFVDVSAKTRENLDDLLETHRHARRDPGAEGQPEHRGVRHRDRVAARPGPRPGRDPARPARHAEGRRRARRRRALRPRARRCTTTAARRSKEADARRCRSRCSASTACPRPASTSTWSANEREARAARRRARQPPQDRGARAPRRRARSRSRTSSHARREGRRSELNLVIKADVAGSLEALADEIAKLPQEQVTVNIVRDGVGGITESDVMLAVRLRAAS